MSESNPPDDNSKRAWFEPVTAILMAVASLSTAWSSYQSSRWGGQSSGLETAADKFEKEAAELHLSGQQIETAQLNAVMEVVDAKLEGDETRAAFYTDRFSGELKPAYEKWMALNPFGNPQAPPHPFVPSLYTPPFHEKVNQLRTEAAQAEAQAKTTGHTADTYLTNTVILATVLFFAGTVGKFTQRHVRWSSLTFAMVLFGYVMVRMLLLPVA
jgi:hypothetical protein